jgi:glycerophosphoryl diester phosphodiesterase
MSSQFQIIAHRGASKYAPENSKSSFDLAVSMGAQAIECDIAFSEDMIPCIFHDDRLERTSSGQGPINQCTWKELQSLDIGSWFSDKFQGESILSLTDLINWHKSNVNIELHLEIKELNSIHIPLLVSEIIKIVGNRPGIVYSSFQSEIISYLCQIQEPHQRAFLSTRWSSKKLALAKQLGCYQMNIGNYGLSRTMVDFTHLQGLKMGVYTVNSAARIEELKGFGVDAVFTDDLKLF